MVYLFCLFQQINAMLFHFMRSKQIYLFCVQLTCLKKTHACYFHVEGMQTEIKSHAVNLSCFGKHFVLES